MGDFLQIECPHCFQTIIIMKNEINCAYATPPPCPDNRDTEITR